MTFENTGSPLATNDETQGFGVNGTWLNTTLIKLFRCDDNAAGAAIWTDITPTPGDLLSPGAVADDRLVTFDGVGGFQTKQGAKTGTQVGTHLDSLVNPHGVTPAQIGAYTTAQVDALVDPTLKAPEAFAPAGSYPTTYDGGAVSKGDSFRITAAGTMGAVTVNAEDLLIALVDTPAQVDANWMVVESNRDQATETVKGVAEIATQAETDAGTNDTNIVTPLKLANSAVPAHTHDHGALTGKGDDDHTQYLLADGTRELTGDLAVTALKKIDGRDLSVDGAKLDGIEAGATADQAASEVVFTPSGDIAATNVQAAIVEVRDDGDTKLAAKLALSGGALTGPVTTTSTFDGRDVSVDGAKLDGIESGAKDDQSAAEVAFTPAGDIAATDVQAAVVEVRDDTDTKLAGKASTTHASAHQNGGGDEVNVGGLSGLLADPQTPAAHTIVSHDTVATGTDLDDLVGGGDANGLHTHAPAQLFIWGFSTNTAAADPGAGRIRANNATPASITALYFSSLDAAGLDFDNFFAMIPVGDVLLAQQTDDATKRLLVTVSGAMTDNAGWWTVPVTVDGDAGGLFANNKDTSWLIRMRM